MVIFLQRTFTSLVHAHAGRTQGQAQSCNAKNALHWTAYAALRLPVLAALCEEGHEEPFNSLAIITFGGMLYL